MTDGPVALNLADPARLESAALDLLPSGIGIFDNDLNLVYANRSFCELRFLPERLCIRGTRLEDIVHYIAARGDYGTGEVDALVRDRMAEILTLKAVGGRTGYRGSTAACDPPHALTWPRPDDHLCGRHGGTRDGAEAARQ
jgi:PAS domain-containing protein